MVYDHHHNLWISFLQMEYIIQKQKYLELLSWQGTHYILPWWWWWRMIDDDDDVEWWWWWWWLCWYLYLILCYHNLLLGGGVQRLLFPPWKPIKIPLQTKNHHDGGDHSGVGGSRNSSSAISGNDSDNIEIDVLLKQLQVLKVTCTTIVGTYYFILYFKYMMMMMIIIMIIIMMMFIMIMIIAIFLIYHYHHH